MICPICHLELGVNAGSHTPAPSLPAPPAARSASSPWTKWAKQRNNGQPSIAPQSRRPSLKSSPTACHESDPVFIRSGVKGSAE